MKTIRTLLIVNFLLLGLNHVDAQIREDANAGIQAKTVSGQVVVTWNTASEPNKEVLVIEHSTDGESFTMLGSPEVAEDHQLFFTYNFTDTKPAAGINYYRVNQTHNDGSSDFSEIVAVHVAAQAKQTLDIIQDPSIGVLEVNVADFAGQNITIEVMNLAGQPIESSQYNLSTQMDKWVKVNMHSHPKGLYYVVLKTTTQEHKEKVIMI